MPLFLLFYNSSESIDIRLVVLEIGLRDRETVCNLIRVLILVSDVPEILLSCTLIARGIDLDNAVYETCIDLYAIDVAVVEARYPSAERSTCCHSRLNYE